MDSGLKSDSSKQSSSQNNMLDRLFASDGKASPIWLYSSSKNKKQKYKNSDLKDYVEKK